MLLATLSLTALPIAAAPAQSSAPPPANGQPAAPRPLPSWYDDAKLGIFVHWGLYSVPAFARVSEPVGEVLKSKGLGAALQIEGGRAWFANNPYAEWYWNTLKVNGPATRAYHDSAFGAGFTYEQFRPRFDSATASWNADSMAALFRRAGARYVVLTTKHHDGFQLWPSAVANPHAPGWQARRDLVGDLTAAVRRGGMRMGLYYSGGIDWTFVDKPIASFADVIAAVPQDSGYARYAEAQMKELVERYRPAVLWNDIGWPRLSDRDALFRWYYGRVPDGVVNDRFTQSMQEAFAPAGAGPRRHFDFATAEYSPETALRASKWEATRGLGLSFGYNRTEDAASMLSPDELVRSFVDVVSKNGNLLLNVGPAADGSIPHDQRVRLEALGRWLGAHGEAIYGTRPWTRAEGTARDASGAEIRVRYTRRAGAAGRGETLYALLLDRPAAGALALADVPAARGVRAHLVGGSALPTTVRGNTLVVTIPAGLPERAVYALRVPQPPKAGARSAAAAAGGRP